MAAVDEEALICDFAETYHIYDYRQLPARLAAVYACGLRQDSRIRIRLSGVNITQDQMLLSVIADSTRVLVWQNTKDGVAGKNQPKSILALLTGQEKEKEKPERFASGEEFLKWRETMMRG